MVNLGLSDDPEHDQKLKILVVFLLFNHLIKWGDYLVGMAHNFSVPALAAVLVSRVSSKIVRWSLHNIEIHDVANHYISFSDAMSILWINLLVKLRLQPANYNLLKI